MKKAAVFALLSSLLTGLTSIPSMAVVNGSIVDKASVGLGGPEDYVVALRSDKRDGFATLTSYCSAVAIAPSVLLTAAHCVKSGKTDLKVIVGANADRGKNIPIEAIFLRDGYNSKDVYATASQNNDLALVQLKKPISESQRVAKLPEVNEQIATGQNLIVIGYGRTSLNNKSVNNPDMGKLRKGTNSLYTSKNGTIAINQTTQSGLCEGDSGGPLLQQTASGFTVWGIARTTGPTLTAEQSADMEIMKKDPARFLNKYKGLDFCKGTGRYTDVRGYLDWIKAKLAEIQ